MDTPSKPGEDFNPRSREGSDAELDIIRAGFHIFQSTLPRRERPSAPPPCQTYQYFNPRSREGSDALPLDQSAVDQLFQSTLP